MSDGEENEPKTDGVDMLWDRALQNWSDDKPHKALLEFALRTENLPEVAGRYRALKDDPEKGARAKKQLDAIVVAATQLMLATKTERPEHKGPPRWLTLVTALICVSMLIWLFRSMLRIHH